MRILVLGATGRVGRHIVAHALKDQHHVTALVRNTDKCQAHGKNVTIIQGNALNLKDIMRAIDGADVVISALNTDGSHTLSESMPLIIKAMHSKGIQRIITVGTAGVLQSRLSPNVLRYQSIESKRKSIRAAEEHHRVYSLLQESRLEWTIVCPTFLPDGEHIGEYRVERDVLPEGGSEISVQDTAEFTYKQITDDTFIRARVGISY